MATIKKAQNGAKTKDSTAYYGNKEYISGLKAMTATNKPEMDRQFNERDKAKLDRLRQSKKGKPGFDKNGYPVKKAQDGSLIKQGVKAVKSLKKLMPSGLKKAQVGTILKKVGKATVAGAAATGAASSTSSCSSGRNHCFHRTSYSRSNNRVPWRKNGGPVAKMKNGGSVKNVSAGPSKKTTIAPKVDPKRTLGNMKSGGKMKKGKSC